MNEVSIYNIMRHMKQLGEPRHCAKVLLFNKMPQNTFGRILSK